MKMIQHLLVLVVAGSSCTAHWSDSASDHWALVAGQQAGSGPLASAQALLDPRPARCVPVPSNLTLCAGVGWDRMRLPNLLEHDELTEVLHQAHSWLPLVSLGCHRHARLFLCSLFAPVCVDQPTAPPEASHHQIVASTPAQAIYPCRSLCQDVKRGCEGRMRAYGYPWPDMLRCDKFPVDNDMCIASHTAKSSDPSKDINSCEACTQPSTFENLVDNYCRAQFVIKAKYASTESVSDGLHLGIDRRRTRIYKSGGWRKRDYRRSGFHITWGEEGRCQCPWSVQRGQQLLFMGEISNGKAKLNLAVPFDRRNKPLKKAVRMFRKNIQCNKLSKLLDKQIQRKDEGENSEGAATSQMEQSKRRKVGGGRRRGRLSAQQRRERKERKQKRRGERRRHRTGRQRASRDITKGATV